MEKLNRVGIKKLIKQYPDIGKILLDEYNIDCMCCKGNCPLKNVVEEENLTLEQEIDLLGKINNVIETVDRKNDIES